MRQVELLYRWCIYVADLDDGSGTSDWQRASLSATKLCGYLCVFMGLGITALEQHASAGANTLVAMGITALFGRSMWKNWLSRNSWTTAQAEVRTHESREIIERRANADFESTP